MNAKTLMYVKYAMKHSAWLVVYVPVMKDMMYLRDIVRRSEAMV